MGDQDPRWDFFQDFTLRTLNLKADKWGKLIGNDDQKQLILDFLEKKDKLWLIITAQGSGALTASEIPPESSKTKGVFFFKREEKTIPKEKIPTLVSFGDLSQIPLDHLSSFVDDVVDGILSYNDNFATWPSVVSNDVLAHVHKLKSEVYEISGSVKGRTLLPMPAGVENVGSDGDLSHVLHKIEGIIIKWTHQVKSVLELKSGQALIDGKNPGPQEELKFWADLSSNLNCIYEQLVSSKVKKMGRILKEKDSSYFQSLVAMYDDVRIHLEEARDISMHLKPIQSLLDDIEQTDMSEIERKLSALYHLIALIWRSCDYYRTPARVVILLQEVCNFMIELIKNFLDPENLLKGELDESYEQVKIAQKVLGDFRRLYFEYREKLPTYFTDGAEPALWEFRPILVFHRFDRFAKRVDLLSEFFQSSLMMMNLEKVEIGGTRGQTLSAQVVVLYEEFQELHKKMSEATFDPLDPDDNRFGNLYAMFKEKLYDMDRRLASILCQAFDDCASVDQMFKLLAIAGNLIERPVIADDFNPKYKVLLETFDEELNTCKDIYDSCYEDPPLHKNQPPTAGKLKWANELLRRIQEPRDRFNQVESPLVQTEDAQIIFKKFEQMVDLINDFKKQTYAKWIATVDEDCTFNLSKPLLERNAETNLISVNFNPKLEAVLREVRYLNFMGEETIPDSAAQLYEKHDIFRQWVSSLRQTVHWYNKVRKTVLDVEFPLISSQLDYIDQMLNQGETTLDWSGDVLSYITEIYNAVSDLEIRVQKAKDNVVKIHEIMDVWAQSPIFERKHDSKEPGLLNLGDRTDRLKKRYDIITTDGQKIHALLTENVGFFKASETSDEWTAYKEYIDEMVIEGLFNSIITSLEFMQDNMCAEVSPFFASELELRSPDMVFQPSLDQKVHNGFYDLIEGLLDDIYHIASLVPRVSDDDGYQQFMEEHHMLNDLRKDIMGRVNKVMNDANNFCDNFEVYSNLWIDDRQEFLNQFLTYGHILTQEEIEAHGTEGVPENPPELTQFKEQIDSYEDLYSQVSSFSATEIFDGWFRVSIKPFKQSLLNIIKKWSYMFKEHLIKHVENSLVDLQEFIVKTDQGLKSEVVEGDLDGLVNIMGFIIACKDRVEATDNMFGPLKAAIELLKAYNHEMPEAVYKQLSDLPEKWNNTKKIMVSTKQEVAPLQAVEMADIRKKCAAFDVKQYEHREAFRKLPMFHFTCGTPYDEIDLANKELVAMETYMANLAENAKLFEVHVPEFKQLKQSRKDVGLVKEVWDLTNIVTSSMTEWKKTLWSAIDIETMETDTKRFAKEIRKVDKEARPWDVFGGLETSIKNMMTSLRVVAELQNPSIRDRHWHQLMNATGVRFTMDEKTSLDDLLKLNLHEYEDTVREIVDKSVKELGMEKMLTDLEAIWSVMAFEHDVHTRTGTILIKSTEELVETLEDNQVQLQNLMTSKYIAFFLEEVSGWQKKLSTTDSVMTIWQEVQRTWSYLESIFIGSEDIRRQLPEDSERFDGIDKDFKACMEDAKGNLNVVHATNKAGLYEQLESMQDRLTLCEKSLAEYLETKRLAFPRFYFVSSTDLLDILSNGNNPRVIAGHLAKLFDNTTDLKFADDTSKMAVGMYSSEREYVDFTNECNCDGQVEVWLNRVMESMRATIRALLSEAVVTYEEKAREKWLFDYAAQVSLTVTQIWWTTEVGIAFGRLEEGYENSMKDYSKKQIQQLNNLITLLLGDLTKGDRQKIMTICTIDVHARDVVLGLIANKTENSQDFIWQRQLRARWADAEGHAYINVCDAQFLYSYEYLGNTPRLVVTPLTDRCYVTLTQSLHLIMGGAPAGPAGTGKTETTKDLGRALGIMVYVFNCSEQMDYKSVGAIYKGLAQAGAWGCFDEFNRISVEVLSVIAVQVKCIQDAIRDKKERFIFEGCDISLVPSVGIFITMNPGYAGRTELPENLKALFRPCAMVVPDFELIAENMLLAEGFLDAKYLAKKFITLYTLCKELLSKQDHYDWGLRAIKSVLVVAGALKRSDRGRPEDEVLMRALRDFNVPKIVTDDMPVFLGLIGDLFPSMDVPRKRLPELEAMVKQSVLDLKLQAEDSFCLKVVQLEELLNVRHSVFVIGTAGTGKSKILASLQKTYANMKRKPVCVDLNPKVVTNDELFGVINPATREWKDGLFSCIMRDMALIAHDGPKWILLDGDIDPMWIESLNTVMDDNKVLTLASNERIPLNSTMRLLFEISNLRTATPATVSRAGILFLNASDLGWNPIVTSWIDTREVQAERANMIILFEKYIPPCIEALRTKFKTITPIPETAYLNTLCYLLECLLTPENVPDGSPKDIYELYFVWACVWAFGGALFEDQIVDHRVEFTKWWAAEFKTIKFPSQGTVFDYYITDDKRFVHWSEMCAEEKFIFDPEMPLQATIVPTAETTRVRFFMDLLMERKRPVMLVGNAGSGKTVLIQSKLNSLGEDFVVGNVPFNFYTTSMMLQEILEKPLEKKAGRNFGPPGSKRIVYFIDDMNMPEVDAYGTVQPHTLIRQHLDYSHWYDRTKLSLKEIHNCQYVSCMNPTSGSFTINPRLQRHFSVFAISFPGMDALESIYKQIFEQHLSLNKFSGNCTKLVEPLIKAALNVHQKVSTTFLPTAIKFHYIFNLRDLSNIFQGMLFSGNDVFKAPTDLARLYIHEATRVYCDKFTEKADIEAFDALITEICKKEFGDLDQEALFATPLKFSHFSQGVGEPKYSPISGWEGINKILTEALDSYNDVNAAMNLVLFEDAMSHILRINRILEMPRGNALLVGVGGSGKQSLSRLAAFISSLDVFQIQLRKGYSITDLKVDLASQYIKAGVKNQPVMFLMTDAQVPQEDFLVLINDLLASGEIPGLFADDELEEIISGVRNDVKATGMEDSRENCWSFFIDRVRRSLKVVLCFSPVGVKLRVRARKFPALVNCTCIDWFHEWPQDALRSVSLRFLNEIEEVPEQLKGSVSEFMAFVHTTVNEKSNMYRDNERKYNYTTPKSFLEQIKLYENLLRSKKRELLGKMERLENGLEKLKATASQVDDLKGKLASQEVELKIKNENADKLIIEVGIKTEIVEKEKAFAEVEEEKVAVISKEVGIKRADCERDLAAAEPALLAAQGALDTLNKNNLTELKSFGSPPPAVVNVVAAVMVLLAPGGKVPKDRSWKAAKSTTMANVGQFLDALVNYDKENIPETCLKAIQPYLDDPDFNPEFIKAKSSAGAGLCSWVINIVSFYRIFCDVEPKRNALAQANADLAAATEKLEGIRAKLKELNDNMAELNAKFEKATNDKLRCQQEADATQSTISLANRLVGGLASENVRWAESVALFKKQEKMLPGDVLLITAFVSYFGYFTKKYRVEMMNDLFLPFIGKLATPIPITPELDPISMLTDDADVASWNNEGLPADRMSKENATILCNCERWPLMVDPQLQGIKWIKKRYEGKQFQIVRLGNRGYLETIERSVSNGDVVLIENLSEYTDPVLDPLLGRNTIKKGRYIKIGDKEVDYHPNFKLILHTKLANPHYQPEMQAQCTLINFTVTREGLEDQLLADVVRAERPDLEELKAELTTQQNQFKITLKKLEDDLLARLSAASGNFLGDTALVENLEITKKTATEIEVKVKEAKITEQNINEAREHYRSAANRASLLYFILDDLNKIHPMYQFSLKAFNVVFATSITRADKSEEVKARVNNLIDSVTFSVYVYATRGLFEKDKLTFTAQVAFQILLNKGEINPTELDFLLRFPAKTDQGSPVDFLSNIGWGGIKTLSEMEEFRGLDRDIEGSAKRWKKFIESECPEKEKFPQEWKSKNSLQKLCMMRCFRPDRMTYAVTEFIAEKLHPKYTENRAVPFATSYEETGPGTPCFFILSPGVDPLKDVEAIGKKIGFTFDKRNFHNVSLGQGQEIVAEQAMELAAKEGHWVILQNVHLVSKWLPTLEKLLESYAIGSNPDFRMYLSAEPAGTREAHNMPQGILENSIKITNEPPTGILANLHKALDNFDQETMESCSRESEFKSILNSVCYFHAVVCERRKFGPQGWNRPYPFNVGDLTISIDVLRNYLEVNSKVPWDDLRYLFGEIMYGGHITDDWDRRLCRTYLQEYMHPDQLEGELYLAPGYAVPSNMDYKGYHAYIDENLPPETPYLYGLHPNAEIGVLTKTSEELFRTLLEMQPKDSGGSGAGVMTMEETVKMMLDEIMEKLPDEFNLYEMQSKIEEITPYTVVAVQECERMNLLINEIRRSLKAVSLGLKGELTITPQMEALMNSFFIDIVPETWQKRAYPSMLGLTAWYGDLLNRIKDLDAWSADFAMPNSLWLGGLFNPQSFLTAIMQSMARKNEWPLDKMALSVDVLKKSKDDINAPPREGAYVHGLFMEGARWDTQAGCINESKLKELTPAMPVLFVKAVPIDRLETKNMYECPVYKTRDRGPNYVWTFNLKTKESANKWVLGGVAILLAE